MAIAKKLALLKETKENIKIAIENKGQTVGEIPFSEYPNKIEQISAKTTYVIGTPTIITIPSTSWDEADRGTTSNSIDLKPLSLATGENGTQMDIPADSSERNTANMIQSGLTLIDAGSGASSLTFSAVHVPTQDIQVAIFGLVSKIYEDE